MPNEQKEREKVRRLVARWVTEIGLDNVASYFDVNKIAEGIACQLLNLIYGYELVELDRERRNFPGVDLGDRKAGVAFQVTARTDTQKIRETLEICKRHGLWELFPAGIRFLILSDEKVHLPKAGAQRLASTRQLEILYAHDLVDDILRLYRSDAPRYAQILSLLQREFGGERLFGQSSLLEETHPMVRVANYVELFRRMYQPEAARFVHLPCKATMGALSSDQLPDAIDQGAVILGPSGCGKSALLKWLAMTLLDRLLVPLLLEAKYYETDLNDLVERAVTAVGFTSAFGFFVDCHTAGRRVLLLLDGLNECQPAKQTKLLTELGRIVQRYNVNVIISTQIWNHDGAELSRITISVDHPSLGVKTAIARVDDPALEPLLTMVATGLEARIVGEIQAAGTESFSRFTLFETYVRKKLECGDGNGFALLVRIARFLSDRLTFSCSVRQVEGLLQESGTHWSALEEAVCSHLLRRSGTRISFAHELLLDFFVAGGIVASLADPAEIVEALTLPKNKGSRLLVLGAIEDPERLVPVLASETDPLLLVAIYDGEAGPAARGWVEKRLDQVLRELGMEVETMAFAVVGDDWDAVRVKAETLRDWNSPESALLIALSFLLARGQYLPQLQAITGVMDTVCDREFRRLRAELGEKKVALRSGLFSAIYVGQTREKAGLTRIFSPLLSGSAAFWAKKSFLEGAVANAVQHGPLSNGQLYLLLLLVRYSEAARPLYAVLMDRFQRYKYLPYHLRMAMIDQCPFACETPEQKAAMTDVLNAIHRDTPNILESSSLFEALGLLGALDEDAAAHEETVKRQLERVLADPSGEVYFGEAAGIFYAQFDHPYASAYQTVLEELPIERKKLFYTMALQDSSDDPLFLISLIFSAARVLDAGVCPYLDRFIQSPMTDGAMPQQSLSVFIYVHLLLAQYRVPLPGRSSGDADLRQQTLFACAELYYWQNRADLTPVERQRAAVHVAALLFELRNEYALEAIWQSEYAIRTSDYEYYLQGQTLRWLTDTYHRQVACVARKAIEQPDWARGIFTFPDELVPHAIDLLKRCGDASDIPLLKQVAEHPVWGTSAVDAIKSLEP